MRYLICYTRPEPIEAKYGPDANFVRDVEVGNFASDEEAVSRAVVLMVEKRYEYFAPSMDALVRDDPAGPQNIFTEIVGKIIEERVSSLECEAA